MLKFSLISLYFLNVLIPSDVFCQTNEIIDAKEDQIIGLEVDSDLILSVRIEKLILGEIFAIKTSGSAMIGLNSLFSILDFPILVDIRNKSAKGWYIAEDSTFDLHIQELFQTVIKVKSQGKSFESSSNNIRFTNDDIYVNANKLSEWLGIKFDINYRDLTLTVHSSEKLPIQKKLLRKNKRPAFSNRLLIAQYPLKYSQYKALSIPFLDIATRYNPNSNNQDSYGYSALGGGDLAYMTAKYYVNGNNKNTLDNFRMTLSRESLDNNLLGPLNSSQIIFGDISPTPTSRINRVSQEVGLRFNNRPIGQATILNQTDFLGDIQPGWDVELYRNGLLIGIQTAEENGRYEFFNKDILFGKNTFKLIFHGPQGQRKEKIKNITLDRNALMHKKLVYDISISKQDSQLFNIGDRVRPENKYNRFIFSLSYGLTPSIALQTAFSSYTFVDGISHQFIQSTIKSVIFNSFMEVGAIKDVKLGHSYNLAFSRKLGTQSILLNRKINTENFKIKYNNSTSIRSVDRAQLSGKLFSLFKLKSHYSIFGTNTYYFKQQNSKAFGLSLGAIIGRTGINNSMRYSKTGYNSQRTAQAIKGEFQASTSFYRINSRAGFSYTLTPEDRVGSIKTKQGLKSVTTIDSLNSGITWRINTKLNSRFGVRYNPSTNFLSKFLSLSWRAKHFTLISSLSYTDKNTFFAYFGTNFSFGYDIKSSAIKISPERISNTGAISAKVFLDENYNGKFESNERTYKGAKIHAVQSRKSIKTNADGKAFLTGLPSDRVSDIKLDVDSLEDPFLIQSTTPFSFLPRPGFTEEVTIPLITSGEIEGTIYLERSDSSTRVAGNVPLTLTNIRSRELFIEKSAFDGYYLFSNIPPGKYLVSIDRAYLKRYKFGARKPMPKVIVISPSGTIEIGTDFSIYALTDE